MAYVEPRGLSQESFDRILRNGARSLALATYGTAVAVAFLILSPVLARGEKADLPNGPALVSYKALPGESPSVIAAEHGLGLSHYFLLNRGVATFSDRSGKPVVVGWR